MKRNFSSWEKQKESTNIHPDRPPGELKAAPSAPCLVEEGELLGLKMFLLLKMLLLFVNPPNGFLFGNWPRSNGFWFCSPGNCWAPPKGFMLLEMSEKELPNFAGPFWAWNPKAWPEFLKPGVCFGCLSLCGCNESIWLCCCCCDCCCGCGNSISSNSDGVSSSIKSSMKVKWQ